VSRLRGVDARRLPGDPPSDEVRIFTHPNGDVTLLCVGREDVVVPPLQPGTKPGVGDVPEGYHVIPPPEAQRALLTVDRNAWA